MRVYVRTTHTVKTYGGADVQAHIDFDRTTKLSFRTAPLENQATGRWDTRWFNEAELREIRAVVNRALRLIRE